ncbi:MAG: hypothetical protein ABEH83_12060 [Halobacterium sp.]
MRVSGRDDVAGVCGALANENRVLLLAALVEMDGGTLREIHERTADRTGLSHRETTHEYLETLVDASLVDKTQRDGDVRYDAVDDEVLLDVASVE